MDLSFLSGKKTYLAAIGLAITAVVQFRAGDVLGAAQSAMAALAAFGLRSALTPAQPPAPRPVPVVTPTNSPEVPHQ